MEKEMKKEVNQLYQKAFENSYDALLVTDAEGEILLVNQASLNRMALKEEDVLGKKPMDLMDANIYVNSTVMKAIKTKKPVTQIVTIREKNCLSSSIPIFDENGNLEFVITNNRSDTVLETYSQLLTDEKKQRLHYQEIVSYLSSYNEHGIIYRSEPMQSIIKTCSQIGVTDGTVILLGESGTGKELLAKYIHAISSRQNHPFIPVNCSAIPPELFESEFFGYCPNAFTGASNKGKSGLVQMANTGTLFLDEVGELPISMQTKLLRFVESGEYYPIGSTKAQQSDVRIIAATSRNLAQMVKNKTFREDLYYRLHVLPIHIPPLRERTEDIPLIAQYYVDIFNQKYNKNIQLSTTDFDLLTKYMWPGNIRELRNAIERTVILDNLAKARITITSLLTMAQNNPKVPESETNLDWIPETCNLTLEDALMEFEKKYIRKVLKDNHDHLQKAADSLGIHRTTLYRKLNKM